LLNNISLFYSETRPFKHPLK